MNQTLEKMLPPRVKGPQKVVGVARVPGTVLQRADRGTRPPGC